MLTISQLDEQASVSHVSLMKTSSRCKLNAAAGQRAMASDTLSVWTRMGVIDGDTDYPPAGNFMCSSLFRCMPNCCPVAGCLSYSPPCSPASTCDSTHPHELSDVMVKCIPTMLLCCPWRIDRSPVAPQIQRLERQISRNLNKTKTTCTSTFHQMGWGKHPHAATGQTLCALDWDD